MVAIDFTVTHDFIAPPQRVWDEMIDWEAHGDWIPATRVEIDSGDPRAVGGRFTGYTGIGPLMLVDRMEIATIDWNPESSTGYCEVNKIGPVLSGTAGFTLTPHGTGTRIEWFEDVTVARLPAFLAPFESVISKLGAIGFGFAMKNFDRSLRAVPEARP